MWCLIVRYYESLWVDRAFLSGMKTTSYTMIQEVKELAGIGDADTRVVQEWGGFSAAFVCRSAQQHQTGYHNPSIFPILRAQWIRCLACYQECFCVIYCPKLYNLSKAFNFKLFFPKPEVHWLESMWTFDMTYMAIPSSWCFSCAQVWLNEKDNAWAEENKDNSNAVQTLAFGWFGCKAQHSIEKVLNGCHWYVVHIYMLQEYCTYALNIHGILWRTA